MKSIIQVNGEPEPLQVATMFELLRSKDIDPQNSGIAVALNGRILQRHAWGSTTLSPGDRVEIVRAFAGG